MNGIIAESLQNSLNSPLSKSYPEDVPSPRWTGELVEIMMMKIIDDSRTEH